MTIALRPIASSLALAALLAGSAAAADKQYAAPGITDTATFGQTVPLSGPASAYSQVGKAEVAYFHMINEKGGVNGRKINYVALDDGYSPPKTVEQTRKLIEEEKARVPQLGRHADQHVGARSFQRAQGASNT